MHRIARRQHTKEVRTPQVIEKFASTQASQPVAVAASTHNWPNLFGPQHDCSTDETIPFSWPTSSGPESVWEKPIGEGYSSPILWEDRLVLTDRIGNEERIICLDRENGDGFWERRYPTAFVCRSTYTNGPYSTPATDGQVIYALSAEGELRCVTLDTGADVWSCDLRAEFGYEQRAYGAGQGPLILDDMLILNVGGTIGESGIVAFERQTGDVIWSVTNHAAGYSTPYFARIHDREILFVLTYDGIVALNPRDGNLYWQIDYRSPISNGENAVTPLVVNDLALFSSYGNGSLCLKILPDGHYETVWESRRNLTPQFTALIGHHGYVYGVHCADHTLRCIELTTGKVQWRERTELRRATCIRSGSKLLLFGEFGQLAAIELSPESCRFLAKTNQSLFDGTFCFASPALVDGKLYLRSEKSIRCVQLTAEIQDSQE